MSSVRSASVLILIVLLTLSIAVTSVSADALRQVSFRDKIYDIALNGDELFVVGFPGILLYSADRGDSFTSIKLPTNDALFAVDLAMDGYGAIVGREGLVLTTDDGGKRWTKSDTNTKEHLFDVSVVSGGKIWAVGHFGTIIHSADGGKSWTVQTYDSTLPENTEAAKSSESQNNNPTAEEENQGAIEEARLNAVSFVDTNNGWVVGEFGLVLHTEDGGATWTRQRSNASLLLFAIHAIDRRNLVAVGSEGTAIESEDGGMNWKSIKIGTSANLLDIFQIEGRRYIVGYDGLILAQENRGGVFHRIPVRVYSWLGSIAFFDERLGFSAGGRGYLLKTIDGGKSWRKVTGKQVVTGSLTAKRDDNAPTPR